VSGLPWAILGNRYVLMAITLAGLMTGAYIKGHSDAAANCHEAALRAQIEGLKRDIFIAADAQARAVEQQKALDKERARLERELSDYDIWIAAHSADGCRLGQHDVDSLYRLKR
jgi:predicted nucleic acid-binding protein